MKFRWELYVEQNYWTHLYITRSPWIGNYTHPTAVTPPYDPPLTQQQTELHSAGASKAVEVRIDEVRSLCPVARSSLHVIRSLHHWCTYVPQQERCFSRCTSVGEEAASGSKARVPWLRRSRVPYIRIEDAPLALVDGTRGATCPGLIPSLPDAPLPPFFPGPFDALRMIYELPSLLPPGMQCWELGCKMC